MAEPTYIEVMPIGGKIMRAHWVVDFDNDTSRHGRSRSFAEALAAVQLAIDEMRDEK